VRRKVPDLPDIVVVPAGSQVLLATSSRRHGHVELVQEKLRTNAAAQLAHMQEETASVQLMQMRGPKATQHLKDLLPSEVDVQRQRLERALRTAEQFTAAHAEPTPLTPGQDGGFDVSASSTDTRGAAATDETLHLNSDGSTVDVMAPMLQLAADSVRLPAEELFPVPDTVHAVDEDSLSALRDPSQHFALATWLEDRGEEDWVLQRAAAVRAAVKLAAALRGSPAASNEGIPDAAQGVGPHAPLVYVTEDFAAQALRRVLPNTPLDTLQPLHAPLSAALRTGQELDVNALSRAVGLEGDAAQRRMDVAHAVASQGMELTLVMMPGTWTTLREVEEVAGDYVRQWKVSSLYIVDVGKWVSPVTRPLTTDANSISAVEQVRVSDAAQRALRMRQKEHGTIQLPSDGGAAAQ